MPLFGGGGDNKHSFCRKQLISLISYVGLQQKMISALHQD